MTIVLFDGDCNLCNSLVQFILKRDKKDRFRFASLQSKVGEQLVKKHHYTVDMSTFVIIKNNKLYTKSRAALELCKELPHFWKLFYVFILVPHFLRDPIYNSVAKNRYKWFGKKQSCLLPKKQYKHKFL